MKKLPLGVQTFGEFIDEDYLYVDKTQDIFNLFAEGGKYYFLSRPRRFGKTLLISTLKEIFSGNKELFKGLWISDKIEWKKYPVIHLDFLGLKYGTPEELTETLDYMIDENARFYEIQLEENGYDKRFIELIRKLSEKDKVVVLVDEYDKPIINHIENQDIAKKNRNILRTFYEVIKGADEYLKFVFITGVSKFSKVSIFSGLNNLEDITVDDTFAGMLGYTHQELLHYFKDRIKEHRVEDIKHWYNGYSWDGKNFVYNPFSVLTFFKKNQFGNYWFASGTPLFLVKLLKEKQKDIREYEEIIVGDYVFESYDIDNLETTSLLFQTGYLTIKDKTVTGTEIDYTLTYPNKEVRDSFIRHLFGAYTGKELVEGDSLLRKLTSALKKGRFEDFFDIIKSLFASISYNIFIKEKEAYYHSIMYMIFRLMGVSVQTEVQTAAGRIAAVIETDEHIMIMEFKMGTAEQALQQIKEKKYYEKYQTSSKGLKLIGIGFNMEQRNINDYQIEEITP
jgi:hypothetical protein